MPDYILYHIVKSWIMWRCRSVGFCCALLLSVGLLVKFIASIGIVVVTSVCHTSITLTITVIIIIVINVSIAIIFRVACVGILTTMDWDDGVSSRRHQWWTNLNDILIGMRTFSFEKLHLKMSSEKWRPFCLHLKVSRSSILSQCQ